MRRLFIFTMMCLSISAQAQWYNATSQKTGLVLSLHLSDSAVSLYSPLQTSDPIPVSSWSFEGDRLTLSSKSIGLKMDLTRKDDTFVGFWKQGLLKEDITFLPADTLFQLRRPQTPQPPYSFDEETVAVDYLDSQGNHVHLEGTLTIPKATNPSTPKDTNRLSVPRGTASRPRRYPCLVLVSGSGQQNRDEELFQHRPFLVIADYLARHGIAVLRYDDRGVGASTGPLDSADTRLFAEDAEAMFRALKDNRHIDTTRLGIGGHSEGAAIAPMVAAKNEVVKYVVMLAGQGCTGLDVMLQQNDAIYRANGLSERLLEVRMACMRELFGAQAACLRDPTQEKPSIKDLQAIILRHTDGLTKEEIDSIDLRKGVAYSLKQQLDLPWMQTFLVLDPTEYMPQVKCPVLALNGEKDCQVVPHPNLDRIGELCPQADCRELPGHNHLFQKCRKGSPDEYILLEETFSEEAMSLISDFINTLTP